MRECSTSRMVTNGARSARAWCTRHPATVGLLGFLTAAGVLFHSILVSPTTKAAQAGRSDPGQVVWFLEWTAHAITHFHNPFLTDAIHAPQGTNLLWNTSVPLAGIVLTPITLAFGPVASFNVLYVLGPTLTAWTASRWLARHVRHELAAWLGGAFIGFGPFMNAHLEGHAHLVTLLLVPVILYLLEDVLWRTPDRRLQRGALLGAALAGQALLSEEIVALLGVGFVIALVAALALRPREVTSALRDAFTAALVAVGVFFALLAIPLGVQFFGPLQAEGASYPKVVSVPQDLVAPTTRFLVHPFVTDLAAGGRAVGVSEVGGYLGIPLLALLLVGLVALRRQWVVWVALATAAFAFWLTTGAGWTADGHPGSRLPFGLLLDVPLLEHIVPARFALVVDLAVAVLAVRTLDHFLGGRRWERAGIVALAGVTALSLVPTTATGPKDVHVPAYFTSSAVEQLPDRAIVLLLPAPQGENAYAAMLWAAEADVRFRMIGGYAYAKRNGVLTLASLPDPVTTAAKRLESGGPPPSADEAAAARAELAQLGVQYVLVAVDEDPGHRLEAAATAIFGPSPVLEGGVRQWHLTP